MVSSSAQELKTLLHEKRHGVLSTFSQTAPGYPFGSLVAYCLDAKGMPVIQLSALAEHTKNISQNPKVSLIITDIKEDDIQNSRRLTILADAARVDAQDIGVKQRYYERFPGARAYGEMLDFSFYRLNPAKFRYVGGFGKALTIEPAEYFSS